MLSYFWEFDCTQTHVNTLGTRWSVHNIIDGCFVRKAGFHSIHRSILTCLLAKLCTDLRWETNQKNVTYYLNRYRRLQHPQNVDSCGDLFHYGNRRWEWKNSWNNWRHQAKLARSLVHTCREKKKRVKNKGIKTDIPCMWYAHPSLHRVNLKTLMFDIQVTVFSNEWNN